MSQQQRQAIDESLLAEVTERWRKVAMVVARAMDRPSHVHGVPDPFYGQRMCALVQEGRVEYMRFSEVRRPFSASPDASRGA